MTKKKRSIKVYGMSGYKYQSTPTILLKGNWLRDLGAQDFSFLISLTVQAMAVCATHLVISVCS